MSRYTGSHAACSSSRGRIVVASVLPVLALSGWAVVGLALLSTGSAPPPDLTLSAPRAERSAVWAGAPEPTRIPARRPGAGAAEPGPSAIARPSVRPQGQGAGARPEPPLAFGQPPLHLGSDGTGQAEEPRDEPPPAAEPQAAEDTGPGEPADPRPNGGPSGTLAGGQIVAVPEHGASGQNDEADKGDEADEDEPEHPHTGKSGGHDGHAHNRLQPVARATEAPREREARRRDRCGVLLPPGSDCRDLPVSLRLP